MKKPLKPKFILVQMVPIPNKKQIHVSGRIWHELYPKVNPSIFLYALRKEIDLSKYGNALNKFYFTFIAEKPPQLHDLSGTYYSPEKKRAEIAINLPYEKLTSASQLEVIKLMEAAYLEGIDLIKTLPLKSNFDVAAFKRDVKAIFAEEGWYLQALEQ